MIYLITFISIFNIWLLFNYFIVLYKNKGLQFRLDKIVDKYNQLVLDLHKIEPVTITSDITGLMGNNDCFDALRYAIDPNMKSLLFQKKKKIKPIKGSKDGISIILPDLCDVPTGRTYTITCKNGETPIAIVPRGRETFVAKDNESFIIYRNVQEYKNDKYEDRKNEFLKSRLDIYITEINKFNRVKLIDKTIDSWLNYICKWVVNMGWLQIDTDWLELDDKSQELLGYILYKNNIDSFDNPETGTIIFSMGDRQ